MNPNTVLKPSRLLIAPYGTVAKSVADIVEMVSPEYPPRYKTLGEWTDVGMSKVGFDQEQRENYVLVTFRMSEFNGRQTLLPRGTIAILWPDEDLIFGRLFEGTKREESLTHEFAGDPPGVLLRFSAESWKMLDTEQDMV